jgi:2-haloacid dehalogenase
MTESGPFNHDISACVFDAYGTLFDIKAAASRCAGELGDKAEPLGEIWRAKQLEYTWLRSLMDAYEDFWQITGASLDYAFDVLDIDDDELRAHLMELYFKLDTYGEVKEMLEKLKAGSMKTAILSNGSPSMLISAVRNAGLQDLLDNIFSVDDLGIFKPHPSVYKMAQNRLQAEKKEICFMSSNAWDVAGAAHFGFTVVWVNRLGQRRERIPGDPARQIKSLSELPALLGL